MYYNKYICIYNDDPPQNYFYVLYSDLTVSEDTVMEPRTAAMFACQSDTLTNQQDLIPKYFQPSNNKQKSPGFYNA